MYFNGIVQRCLFMGLVRQGSACYCMVARLCVFLAEWPARANAGPGFLLRNGKKEGRRLLTTAQAPMAMPDTVDPSTLYHVGYSHPIGWNLLEAIAKGIGTLCKKEAAGSAPRRPKAKRKLHATC